MNLSPLDHVGHRVSFDWHKCGCCGLRCETCAVEGYHRCAEHPMGVPRVSVVTGTVWGFSTADPSWTPHGTPVGPDDVKQDRT